MSGGSMTLENNGPMDSGETLAEATRENSQDAPMVPRVRIDVEKQRQHMDSFRTVSTHSVEKALVTHALRTERLSINGRIFLVCVMGFMSAFLAIANYKGIINYPALIWVTLLGVIAAGLELTRKMYAVKSKGKALIRCEESCAGKASGGAKAHAAEPKNSGMPSKRMAPVPPPLSVSGPSDPRMETSGHDAVTPTTSPYAAIAAVTSNKEFSPLTIGAIPTAEGDDREKNVYFEL